MWVFSVCIRCADPWDDHVNEGLTNVNQSLLQRLGEEVNVSIFLDLLKTSGLDKNLDGRNAYTVFAPTNESIQSLVTSLKTDPEALETFVQNHIAVSTHRLNTGGDTVQITMLNGKILDLVNSQIGGVAFAKANQGSANGLYHVINEALMPQQNLWEFINSNVDYMQNQFVLSLNTYNLLDTAAGQDDPEDEYLNNEFLHNLADVRVEKDRFTYFVLNNATFEQEVNGFLPYVNYRNEADSSLAISRYHIVKDLIFAQAYDLESLPDQLVSISGVEFPIDKNAIVETIPLSNGYVHVLNTATLPVANKLLDLVIEGEDFIGTTSSVPNSTFVREKMDPSGNIFRDLMIQNHGVSSLGVRYALPYLLSTNYDVYWRAVNDIQANVFQQRVVMTDINMVEDEFGELRYPTFQEFPYMNVEVRNYNEVYLGEFELAELKRVNAFLTGAAVTTNGNNTIVADYLRFVPKVKQN
jgi:uncharacterized surface protein with fasciclin (FAS1) repeats